MAGYQLIQTAGNATATYKFTPKYVLKAGQKVLVGAERVRPPFGAGVGRRLTAGVPATAVFPGVGLGCRRELQAAQRFGVEEPGVLGLRGGRSGGAAQPSGRGGRRRAVLAPRRRPALTRSALCRRWLTGAPGTRPRRRRRSRRKKRRMEGRRRNRCSTSRWDGPSSSSFALKMFFFPRLHKRGADVVTAVPRQ